MPPTVRLRYAGSTDELPSSAIAYQASLYRVVASTLRVTKNSNARRHQCRIGGSTRPVLEIEERPRSADVQQIEQLGFRGAIRHLVDQRQGCVELALAIASTSAGVLMLFSWSRRIAQKPSPSSVYANPPNTATRARSGASGTFACSSVQAVSRFRTSSDWKRAVCIGVYAPKGVSAAVLLVGGVVLVDLPRTPILRRSGFPTPRGSRRQASTSRRRNC